MNLLSTETESQTIDIDTGKNKSVTGSAVNSPNLSAVTYNSEYSKETAEGYSRDRAMFVSSVEIAKKYPENGEDCVKINDVYNATNNTIVAISNALEKFWRWIVSIISGRAEADADLLVDATKDSISTAVFSKPSETTVGEALGERLVEGAAYYNTMVSREVGGSTASDKNAIAVYNKMVTDSIAQKAKADRATKSPFDASSPYTFLGSIVNSLQPIVKNTGSVVSKVSSLNNLTAKSVARITTGAYAEGNEETYQMQNGNCSTENSIGGEGDIYCNEAPSFDPSTFSMTLTDLQDKIAGDLDERKRIKDGTDAARYLILHTERESTPGVKDATVCEAIAKEIYRPSILESIWNFFAGSPDIASICSRPEVKDYATGKEYANTAENANWNTKYKYYQGYTLEVYVMDLFGYYSEICDEENPVVAYKNEYYTKHPKDNSPEGILARRTGMTKDEVIAGIEAVRYLAYLNNYDPATRYAFGGAPELRPLHFEDDGAVIATTFADEKRRIVYADRRNRKREMLVV